MPGFVDLSPVLARSGDSMAFLCPGCEEWHSINIGHPDRPLWTWNGEVERPTFRPSILVRTGQAVDPNWVREDGDPPEVCHSFVTDGRIEFLSDCSHALAGQTVDLPPFHSQR